MELSEIFEQVQRLIESLNFMAGKIALDYMVEHHNSDLVDYILLDIVLLVGILMVVMESYLVVANNNFSLVVGARTGVRA